MRIDIRRTLIISTLFLGLPLAASCGRTDESSSTPLVTDVKHSEVKRQSIGNCWLYAAASWVESLHLSATDEELNTSESYWTWWHWFDQIVGGEVSDEIGTGGYWAESTRIIMKHGVVLEGQFLPDEANLEMSRKQAQAESYINEQLKRGGKLATARQRTARNVRAQLDIAFGSDMAATQRLAIPANRFVAGKDAQGRTTTLDAALRSWRSMDYPQISGENATASARTIADRKALLTRALKAVNDRKPVLISIMVDFNALNTENATFEGNLAREAGAGHQGGHMVVLEDYAVDNVPGVGSIEEGDVSDELKAAALTGTVRHLVAKNSWGKDRPDRGLTDGYTRFDASYMHDSLPWWTGEEHNSPLRWYSALNELILPPGY